MREGLNTGEGLYTWTLYMDDINFSFTFQPTAIIRKLCKIQESMLKKYDAVLYNHLRDMQIEPQLYGL